MTELDTPKGKLLLAEPSVEFLQRLRELLPYGLARFSVPQNGADYGIVMQCDEDEVLCIKQQPPDCSNGDLDRIFPVNGWHLAQTFPRYAQRGFSGLYLACPYVRKKEDDRAECGFAHFIFPSPRGIESQEFDLQPAFDNQFGHGATVMLEAFCLDLQQLAKETKLPLVPTVGLDVRKRLQVGSIQLGFLALGSTLVCLRTVLREEDPTWTILVSSGITKIIHLPSIPMMIHRKDLTITKGSDSD
jgi:hypothetical protein